MFLRVVLAALLLSLTLAQPATARAPTPAAAPTSAKEESDRLRADMEGQVERLRLNVETFMQTQDKRIGDLQFYGNMNNGLIALLAIVVTALVVYMAFNFARSAKEEARAAVRDWLEEKAAGELAQKLATFDGKLDQMAADRLAQLEAKHSEQAAPLIAELQEGCALMRESLGAFQMPRASAEVDGSVSDTVRDPKKLRPAAAAASAKAPEDRDFDDWYLMAWAAMEERNFGGAYHNFAKARAVGTSDRLLALKAVFNGAIAAMELGRWNDVLSLSDAVLQQWRANRVNGGEVLAVKSFARKGLALGQLQRGQEALEVFDAALAQPWDVSDPEVAIGRAQIPFKRAVTLHVLGATEEVERHYDDFIRDYGTTTNEVLQIDVAAALYNKMLLRRKAKDTAEENRLLDEIDRRFGTSDDPDLADIVKSVKFAISARKSKAKQAELVDL